jgi:hypothetical protein
MLNIARQGARPVPDLRMEPHVVKLIDMSIYLGKIICIPDAGKAAERESLSERESRGAAALSRSHGRTVAPRSIGRSGERGRVAIAPRDD